MTRIALFVLIFGVAVLASGTTSSPNSHEPRFTPCEPDSEFGDDLLGGPSGVSTGGEANIGFCADWNPEFANNGYRCCTQAASMRKKRSACAPHRRKYSYCDEMTEDQKKYADDAAGDKLGDVLKLIESDSNRHRNQQAFCFVNNGFLVWGRPLVPSTLNRIRIRDSRRCTEFGTDAMAGMLEWAGRQVAKEYSAPEYSGVHLLIGDIAAPRGGCLSGRGGRRGHKSHTTGQDADIGYLTVKAKSQSPEGFHRNFDPKTNWWLLKLLFKNPHACVKVVFLDRRNIQKLAKEARNDPDWAKFGRFIRHVKGHRDHMHVRIGDAPGEPGCSPNANPDLEVDEEIEAGSDAGESSGVDQGV